MPWYYSIEWPTLEDNNLNSSTKALKLSFAIIASACVPNNPH
jgi:hypothetical protein